MYYGDPQVVRMMLQGIPSFTMSQGTSFEDTLDQVNSLVVPVLEADLTTCFSSWPAPQSAQVNTISVLWCYAMVEEYTGIKFQQRQSPVGYEQKNQSKYERLLERIQKGELPVPGAVRRASFTPVVSEFTSKRAEVRDFEEPVVVGEVFPVGLRGNVSR